jgi:hypothetical protein
MDKKAGMKKKCCGKYALKGHRATESQAIEFITAHKLDFIDGNIVKYAVRKKDGETDVERYKKIKHYAELALELKCGSH